MKKVLAAVVTMAMTMSLLTACGSTAASTDEAAETTEATEATEASADETAEAETPVEEAADEAEVAEAAESEALADGVLTVGTNAEFPPFEYVDDNGEADGFDMALCKAIGEKLGVEVKIENMEFASLVSSIGSKIDIAAAGMTVTDERKESVDFSNPYYEAVQYVIVSADSDIATADDLKDKTIGVQLGTTGDFIAEEYTSNVAQYNKAVDAVNDLVNGKVDVVIIDKNPALVFETKFEGKVKAIEGAQFGFETEEYAIALPKGDAALADAVNGAVDELKADGTFDELVKTYIEAE
ncbi:basic amino acid ABC transporter substrate-binding protein [Suilimivivens sp.]|uniref:basic amino acid ABC transporter substrate-binding protein n=1 Tax=Suilimivivens sp. TaxID=2981669 RepID=UPI003079679F